MARGRVTREDWTMAALGAIARGGLAGVAVDSLAGELGITRGSFYWHFKDRDALLVAAMEFWEQRATVDVIAGLTDVVDPREKLRTLLRVALGEDVIAGLEPAILAHADHPAVAPVLARVTRRRLDYLGELYAGLGLTAAVARRQAVVAYAAYLGWKDLRHAAAGVVPEVAEQGVRARNALNHLIEQLVDVA